MGEEGSAAAADALTDPPPRWRARPAARSPHRVAGHPPPCASALGLLRTRSPTHAMTGHGRARSAPAGEARRAPPRRRHPMSASTACLRQHPTSARPRASVCLRPPAGHRLAEEEMRSRKGEGASQSRK
ncbi:hypothetical protein PR202_ga10422 [Eleusine coracana subsp. coracana]|uniref:Uncharacterized protein n=1 Tax=Eleusine coracana subsp. coracana TaxID=191504 RepID=A0AAV5C6M0_ELECO|nr:hypothetical protein PR202_ga10422 [Eleusine coracana subsp. coracana]